jgi:hypothetical protein
MFGKSRRYPLDRLDGPQSRSGRCGVGKNLLPLAGTRIPAVAIPTEQLIPGLVETKISAFKTRLNLQSQVATICITCFNILELCILPTECVCVFRVVLTINSDCFPKQHQPVGLCNEGVMFSVRYGLKFSLKWRPEGQSLQSRCWDENDALGRSVTVVISDLNTIL